MMTRRLHLFLLGPLMIFTLTGARPQVRVSEPPLPVYEWNRVNVPERIQTGDRIALSLPLENAIEGEYKLQPSAPQVRLWREGWTLELLPVETGANELRVSAIPIRGGEGRTLPALDLTDPEGKKIGRTQPFSVDVASALADSEKPPALIPPVELEWPRWLLHAVAGSILLFLILLSVGIVFWVKHRSRFDAGKSMPVAPPREDVVALEALRRIESGSLLERGEHKVHYFGVSEILKEYFGARFRFDALESTTDELLATLEKKGVEASTLDDVEALYHLLDRVKFTDHVPEREEGRKTLEMARRLIERTRKREQPIHAV